MAPTLPLLVHCDRAEDSFVHVLWATGAVLPRVVVRRHGVLTAHESGDQGLTETPRGETGLCLAPTAPDIESIELGDSCADCHSVGRVGCECVHDSFGCIFGVLIAPIWTMQRLA